MNSIAINICTKMAYITTRPSGCPQPRAEVVEKTFQTRHALAQLGDGGLHPNQPRFDAVATGFKACFALRDATFDVGLEATDPALRIGLDSVDLRVQLALSAQDECGQTSADNDHRADQCRSHVRFRAHGMGLLSP